MVRRRVKARALALLSFVTLTACGRGNRSDNAAQGRRDSSAAASAIGSAGRTATPSDSSARRANSCPEWGAWQQCSVEYRLTRAGLVVKLRSDTVRQPFLHVPGMVYDAGNAEIQVYLYPSASARAKDTDVLDSTTVSPPGQPVTWKEPATLVVSNNLAAIILTLNDRQAERIALALGAGMPLRPPGR